MEPARNFNTYYTELSYTLASMPKKSISSSSSFGKYQELHIKINTNLNELNRIKEKNPQKLSFYFDGNIKQDDRFALIRGIGGIFKNKVYQYSDCDEDITNLIAFTSFVDTFYQAYSLEQGEVNKTLTNLEQARDHLNNLKKAYLPGSKQIEVIENAREHLRRCTLKL